MALLEVKDLEVYYGVIQALKGISFEVNEGEIVTLIGANGAGKTTTMQSVIGLIASKAGTVTYDGKNITHVPCHKLIKLGMSQVPEGRRIFQELSVYDNLLMGAYTQKDKKLIKETIEKVYDRFPRLKERKNLVDEVFTIIKELNAEGTTVLLVEQNAGKSLAISDRAYVLENGRIVLSGTGEELLQSDKVKKAYLGE